MNTITDKVKETVSFLQINGIIDVQVAVVLGTGLGALIQEIDIINSMTYKDIPNFVTSTVEFHQGKLIYGKLGNKTVLVMQGRFHYYEGYSMQQITFPIRVFKALGIKNLVLSNAAGGMHNGYKKGDLVIINDHINLLPENPLRGAHEPGFGERFVDMCAPYSATLNLLLKRVANTMEITLHEGVYVAVQGPNLETKAEYKYLMAAGADMVGMSTVPEVIVANQVGLSCCAVSVITDECHPDTLQPVSIAEIIAVAALADKKLSKLFTAFLQQL
jgi:purine-nucleoside phosphorylase